VNKRIVTGGLLRAMYPPMPEAFARETDEMLTRLPKRGRGAKRRVSAGLLIAALVTLLAAGALAAAIHWNVMDYLFGGDNSGAVGLVKNLQIEEAESQVTITVDSALCDGELLAMDWTVRTLQPDQPAYLQVDRFTLNGVDTATDGSDDFDCQWLPNYGEDTMCGGETVELPDGLAGDTLHVAITVGVYRPKAPIYVMDEFDADEAAQKAAQGYYVIAEDEGLVVDDPEEGWMHCYGPLNETDAAAFDRTTINLDFDIDLAAARGSRTALTPETSYCFDDFTAAYTKAVATPVALYLELEVQPADDTAFDRLVNDGDFLLTDGDGNELDTPFPEIEELTEPQPDGTRWREIRYRCVGLAEADLPDVVSLSWQASDGGEQYILPVFTR
jgi:hypothetical protein